MKKTLLILVVLVVVLAAFLVVVWANLARITTYALGRAVGGEAKVEGVRVSLREGAVSIDLSKVTLTGDVEATIGSCRLDAGVGLPLTVRYVAIDDFQAVVKKGKGGFKFLPVGIEKAEIKRGTVSYAGKTWRINEFTVTNFNTGKPSEFSIDGSVDGFGRLKMKGGGDLFEKRSEIQGEFSLKGLQLESFLKDWYGDSDYDGKLRYSDGRLTVDGAMVVRNGSLWEPFLRKPVKEQLARGNLHLSYKDGFMDGRLEGLHFKATPLLFDWTIEGTHVVRMQFSSGPLAVDDIHEYVDLEAFGGKRAEFFTALTGGTAEVKRMVTGAKTAFAADLLLSGLRLELKGIEVEGISGSITLDERKMTLRGCAGRYGSSTVSDVSGTIPFYEDRGLVIRGNYDLNLADLQGRLDSELLQVVSGQARGTGMVRASEEGSFAVEAEGTILSSKLKVKGLELGATGNYRLAPGMLTLEPLRLEKGRTRVDLRGTVGTSARIDVSGDVETAHVQSLVGTDYRAGGVIEVNGTVKKDDGFSAQGSIGVERMSFEIPGVFRKPASVPGRVEVSLAGRADEVAVDRLDLNLAGIGLQSHGHFWDKGIKDLSVTLDAASLGQVAHLFFLDEDEVAGSLRMTASLKDTPFPLTKLPDISGSISLKKGAFKFPDMVNGFKNVDLDCRLAGETHLIRIEGLKLGRTAVREATIRVEGRESPSISAQIALATLDPIDFQLKREKPFRVPVIPADSLLGRTRGSLTLRADRLFLKGVEAEGLQAGVTFGERVLEIDSARMAMAEGTGSVRARISFAEPVPRFSITGGLASIGIAEVFRLFETDLQVVQGKAGAFGEIHFEGSTPDEFLRSVDGRISAFSSDGVIRKWSLLSKIFGLLNVYDLVRGKLRLGEEGLPYRVMSATFSIDDGVFHTDNFLLDSPSMVMVARGNFDLPRETVDAKVQVAPLVALDRTIDKIPLIGRIFVGKDPGFLVVEYSIDGPLGDPRITSNYVTSIPSKALGILKNILQLPVGLIEGVIQR